MILTCQNCQARYLVPPHVLGVAGRRVRCTSCGYEWHQANEDPQDEDPVDFRSILEAVDPIPESVKPVNEEKPILQPAPRKKRTPGSGAVKGYAAAALVVLAAAGAVFPLKNPIVSVWPPAAALYIAIGQDVPVAGEGLVFDQMKAVGVPAEGVVRIEGRIINLKSASATVPAVEAAVLDENDKPLASHIVDVGGHHLKGQGEIAFAATYPEHPGAAKMIRLRFVFGAGHDSPAESTGESHDPMKEAPKAGHEPEEQQAHEPAH